MSFQNICCERKSLNGEVPQSSILDPLLFALIDDITEHVDNCKVLLYASHRAIFISGQMLKD